MTAGRELDALVAIHVMGVRQAVCDPKDACAKGARQYPAVNGNPNGPVPHYSTDIAAAWKVVEKMHEFGLWMRLQSPFDSDHATWNAGFTSHSFTGWNGRPEHAAQGDTAPLAICLAALRALGVDVPK